MQIQGTKLFTKALKEEAVDMIFVYPGACNIDLFDALYDEPDIEMILARHEQGLAHAADGYARSSGKVGVCLVTSGPGATNLVTAIATANYDSVPMVCFTGQVATGLIGNDAFQEVDIVGITKSISKYSITVRKREDLGRIIKEAFYIARSGRPGPVVVDLPKDVMLEMGEDRYPDTVSIRGYKPSSGVHMGQIKKAMELLVNAKKPLFLIGGGVNISHARSEFTELANIMQIPVITTILGKGAIPTKNPLFVGNIGMHGSYAANMAASECDVLFSIGTRFNDRITGKITEFASNAKIVHIDVDPASISRNIKVDVPIVADAKEAVKKLLESARTCSTGEWLQQIQAWKEERPLESMVNTAAKSGAYPTPKGIIEAINRQFDSCIMVTDVGQNQMFTTQYLEMDEKKQLLTSGGLGTMGYGLPAAIGAKLANPEENVIMVAGDGGMQMNIQEMATAVAHELPLVLCIFNNGYLGMVKQWQQLFYEKRYSGTCMRYRISCKENCGKPGKECPPYTPDYVKLAESYGANGIRVTDAGDVAQALQTAAKSTKVPTIIEFIIEDDLIVLPMVKSGQAINEMILDC